MSCRRALPKRGRSTVVFFGGLAAGLIGAALGEKFPAPVAPPHPLAVAACHPTNVAALPATAGNTGAPDSLADGQGLESGDPARALEALAARDSARALALAFSLAGGDPLLRQHLLDAVLRGWAQVAPEAATDWCLHRPFAERAADAAAVLAGAATDTDRVLRLASRFVSDDPPLAHDHGCSLVYVLAQAGEFGLAARFAATGPDANREGWVRTAFTVWAEHQPERAMAAVAGLSTPQLRAEAFEATVAGWAATDPAGLAKYAALQAAEADRLYALHSAFSEWVSRDLVGASEWLCGRPPGAEFDVGAAAVATAGPLVTLWPELALNWAESMTDAGLRSGTIASIVHEWAKSAPVEAYHYAETSSDLLATDRTTVLAEFTATPGS